MANAVASTHRQAPPDHELLNIGEPLRPLEFRTRPLHLMSRWLPIWRRNLVALPERRPGRANSPRLDRIPPNVRPDRRSLSLGLASDLVPGAGEGFDDWRAAEFLAQLHDGDADCVGEGVCVGVPHAFEEVFRAYD